MSPPIYFPLRWERTGDQWWYASPIDWAAANGHYDLVRELLRLDGNHLIKLTSLRRIRRLETVWDDEEQFHDVAKCRSEVARKLLSECEIKKGKNSLIGAGYGGWLLYTAASAGDLSFVQELLERDPLLVFGEGEYGVTDILYAAARSKNFDVFKVVFDFAASPRFSSGEEQVGEIPPAYKLEIMNRALHAAARGGNLKLLKELLGDCSDDAMAYRDIQGATVLHAAAARGQVELVKDLASSSDIINSTDNQGNTALHVAAHRGHLPAVEALILASPSLITATNNAGETFLHSVVTGFQTPGFRRLDRQIDLMKHLLSGKLFNVEEIINAKNNDGRTPLHLAIMGNIHSDLVELLMTVRCIDVNIRDIDGMTPLDILRQRPHSASSELLTRQLISAGGMFSSQDYSARRVIASHIKKQSIGSSPGTSFRISDVEIFLYTGLENASDGSHSVGLSTYSPDVAQQDANLENQSRKSHKLSSVNYAAQRLKRLLHWPKMKHRTSDKLKKLVEGTSGSASEGVPVPLRERFSKPSSLPNNKRTLSVRSNVPSPAAKKKLASGVKHGVMQAIPNFTIPHRSRSSSFSKISVSSQSSSDTLKGGPVETDTSKPSCSTAINDDGAKTSFSRHSLVNKKLVNQYLCFGGPGQHIEAPPDDLQPYDLYERSVLSTA
ncbi:26S proteasome regulatory complex, subunit PSMD10 [Handroanthus impetiginosus]|uniref:26S proteasome regulatory complex, subunit PSMD10 n=1 Tax=Handroanthus impetiginosus TaxID=429701 RepID=A0A2G9GUZ2_9LAMI|nr:26S proteasome regulatory complex, subunit PSMD10 [Handroanthus impetiginosus]